MRLSPCSEAPPGAARGGILAALSLVSSGAAQKAACFIPHSHTRSLWLRLGSRGVRDHEHRRMSHCALQKGWQRSSKANTKTGQR